MSIKITQLGNLTGVYGNTIVPVVANVAGDWTTVKGNLEQFGTWINRAELPYGNIIPFADAVYSLGTPSYRFKDLYLLGTTIYLGNANISVSNASVVTSLPLTAPAVTTDTVNVSGNVVANNISISGDFGVNDITATGTVSAGDVTATGIVSAGNVTATGTVSAVDVTATGVLTALDVATGNITANDITSSGTVSAADVTATGNITAANIEVSGNVIMLGGATLDVTNGTLESSIPIAAEITSTSNLNVQGASITFAQGSYIVEEEVFGSPGEYALTLTSAEDGIVGLNAMDANDNVLSSIIVSNSSAQINVANIDPGTGNVNVWYFDNIGGVIFPDGTRQDTAFDSATIYSNVDVAAYLSSENITSYGNVNVNTYLTNEWQGLISGNVGVLGWFAVANVYVPTASNSVGIAGQIVWDSDYLYVCVSPNVWKRANIATW